MKTIRQLLTILAVLVAFAPGLQAQGRTDLGCGTETLSAVERRLVFTNGRQSPVNFSGSYHTTGTPATVSIRIETGNVLAGTSAPFIKIAAITDTTSGQFAETIGGERFWYANLTALTGGASPTVVLNYCVREITAVAPPQLALTASMTSATLAGVVSDETGSGAAVFATSPSLVTPAVGAATGTSLDATSFLDTGVAGTTLGELRLHNTTSGTITVSPGTGALGAVTMTAPNFGVGSALLASTLTTNTIDAANSIWAVSGGLRFEGSTADGNEGTITFTDPAAPTTVTVPAIASGAFTLAVTVPWRDELTGSAVDRVFFTATRGWIIDSCSQVHSVAAGGVSTMQLVKDTGTTAPGAGTDLLTAAYDLNATANTVQAKVAGDFVSLAARTLAIGDRISVDYANAIQSTAGNSVTCLLFPN